MRGSTASARSRWAKMKYYWNHEEIGLQNVQNGGGWSDMHRRVILNTVVFENEHVILHSRWWSASR
jgi:hypothetical protein